MVLKSTLFGRAMSELMDHKAEVELLLIRLLCHLTTLDATVLGLLAALCDRPLQGLCILVLTTLGVLTLFVSLVGGVAYMCRYYWQQLRIYNNRYQALTQENPDYEAKSEDIGVPYILAALFCPIGSALGLLFLLLSLLIFLWS